MQQVIVDFGRLEFLPGGFALRIYGYGLMLVLGFVLGIVLARRRARRAGEDPQAVATLGLLALVGGVAGSRLAFVIEKWDERFASAPAPLLEMLNITSGGLIYYGGVALAVALILAYLAARRLPARRYFDIITPSLMIGLAFGRMGCLLNGCCYGGRCRADWPLAMRFPYASKPVLKLDGESNAFGGASVSPVFAHQAAVGGKGGGLGPDALPGWLIVGPAEGAGGGVVLKSPADLTDAQAERAAALRSLPVQPAQALGIVNALLLAGILLCFHRLRRREGQVFPVMLLLYPITRIVLESIRGDNPHDLLAGRLTHNQWVSLGLVAAGGAMLLLLRRLPPAAGPTWGRRLALAQTRDRTGQTKRKGKQR